MGITVLRSLYLNLEYDNYNLDQQRNDFSSTRYSIYFPSEGSSRRKSASRIVPVSYLEINGSYAYSNYDPSEDTSTNGNIAKLGFMFDFWKNMGLRAFQGFYYIDGGEQTDYAVGVNTSLYEQIRSGWQLAVRFRVCIL